MQNLRLTSPLMHGPVVSTFQDALNQHGAQLKVDGQYGPASVAACHTVAWDLGLNTYVGVPAVQRIIEGHELRSPMDLERARKRAAQRAKAGTGLAAILTHGLSFKGTAEHPAGSNGGDPEPGGWIRACGMEPGSSAASPGPPWCAIFYTNMAWMAGFHLVNGRDTYVPDFVADARAGASGWSRFVPWDGDRSVVKPGWAVCYAWNGSHLGGDHVGIVEQITSTGVMACEGNTSGENPSDGGEVALMARSSVDIVGYCEPRA